jgi:hypothetical protein
LRVRWVPFGPGHMKVDTFGKRYLHTFLTLKLD